MDEDKTQENNFGQWVDASNTGVHTKGGDTK